MINDNAILLYRGAFHFLFGIPKPDTLSVSAISNIGCNFFSLCAQTKNLPLQPRGIALYKFRGALLQSAVNKARSHQQF